MTTGAFGPLSSPLAPLVSGNPYIHPSLLFWMNHLQFGSDFPYSICIFGCLKNRKKNQGKLQTLYFRMDWIIMVWYVWVIDTGFFKYDTLGVQFSVNPMLCVENTGIHQKRMDFLFVFLRTI